VLLLQPLLRLLLPEPQRNKTLLLALFAVAVLGVRQNCVPVRNPLSNEYVCTRVQKWINEISQLGDKATCAEMVNNDLIESFSTVTEADDCSLNWPTPDYEKPYVEAYQDKISKAYQKYKPEQLRKLAGSILESAAQGADTKNLQERLFRILMARNVDGGSLASVSTEVHYVRMTAEEYLRRIKANLGDECEVPRWPCCSELLRKLEEEALAKQLAEQAAAAAAAAAAGGGSETPAPTPEVSSTGPEVPVAPETPEVPLEMTSTA